MEGFRDVSFLTNFPNQACGVWPLLHCSAVSNSLSAVRDRVGLIVCWDPQVNFHQCEGILADELFKADFY